MSGNADAAAEREALHRWSAAQREMDISEKSDGIACREEAVRDWLAWIFDAGPEPLHVARRLVACTCTMAPWLLQGLLRNDARTLEAGGETRFWRMLGASRHDAHFALMAVYHRHGRTWEPGRAKSLPDAIAREEASGVDALIRAEALRIWLMRLWDADVPASVRPLPQLCEALKAVYVEARCLAPELTLNMSGEELASLFGQGRAAESARVRRRANEFLARCGFRNTTMRFQKSETVRAKYAAAARGNRNRARGSARTRAA